MNGVQCGICFTDYQESFTVLHYACQLLPIEFKVEVSREINVACRHSSLRCRITATIVGVPGSQWVCDLERPGEISDVLCFLTAPLPCNDEGAGIYYSIPPFTNWEFIGAITNVKPSALLSTGWAFLPQTSQLPVIKLGIMLERAPALQEKLTTTPLPDVKKEYARRVALNLYRYLESFQGGAAMPLLDQWFQRFEARYQRDPNFVMKSE